jgi:hypothetical protein
VHDIEETQRTSERLIDTLRAVLEETDIRIAELKKEAYEFKRDIVVGAENMRTGKTVAEKVYSIQQHCKLYTQLNKNAFCKSFVLWSSKFVHDEW